MDAPQRRGSCLPAPRAATRIALTLLLLLGGSPGAIAQEDGGVYYYLLLFAKNDSSGTNEPYLSHTFARFVRMSGRYPGDPEGRLLEPPTDISWVPEQGFDKNWPVVLKFLPGKNLDLTASIAEIDRNRAQLTLYGPFRVTERLYRLAQEQERRLRHGQIRFRAFGVFLERERNRYQAFNCYEAVSDIGGYTLGQPIFGLTWGDEATRKIVEDFAPHILPVREDLGWLLERFDIPCWVRRCR